MSPDQIKARQTYLPKSGRTDRSKTVVQVNRVTNDVTFYEYCGRIGCSTISAFAAWAGAEV